MSEQEIEDLKKENILLRLQKERLENDVKKYQNMIKELLVGEMYTELANEDTEVENESTTTQPAENNT